MQIKTAILISIFSSVLFFHNCNDGESAHFDKSEIIEVYSIKPDYTKYLEVLSFRESSNVWDTVGGAGGSYIGLYQMGSLALKTIELGHITVAKFKRNPKIFTPEKQKEACIALAEKNKHYLCNYMSYVGKTINGVKITKAGMLAGAHLCGYKKVKEFLETGKVAEDGFGTKITEYFELMQDVHV